MHLSIFPQFGLWGRRLLDSFSRSGGKYRYNRKNRCRKTCNSKPFSIVKRPMPNSRSFCDQFLHLLRPILPGIPRSIDLLRGQSSIAFFGRLLKGRNSSLSYVPAVARSSKNSWKIPTPNSTIRYVRKT